jgi:hypothetical protein
MDAERVLMAERDEAIRMCDCYADENQRISDERDAARADERERCITAAEDAYIAGRGAKGCIDAIRAIGEGRA